MSICPQSQKQRVILANIMPSGKSQTLKGRCVESASRRCPEQSDRRDGKWDGGRAAGGGCPCLKGQGFSGDTRNVPGQGGGGCAPQCGCAGRLRMVRMVHLLGGGGVITLTHKSHTKEPTVPRLYL